MVNPQLKGGNMASCMATGTFYGGCILYYTHIYICLPTTSYWATQAHTALACSAVSVTISPVGSASSGAA